MSRDIGRASLLAGGWSADQRVAAFLVALSRRLAARGFAPHQFQLTMVGRAPPRRSGHILTGRMTVG